MLALSSLFFLGCKKTEVSQTETPSLIILSNDPAQVKEQTNNNLLKAKQAAKTWKENNQHIAFVTKVYPQSQIEDLTETFVFGSPDDSQNWWTYSITPEGEIVRSLTPKEDYLGTNFNPIKEEYLKITYLEALKTADDVGGANFRKNNPNLRINLVLCQTNPKGWLWWRVEYQANDLSLKFIINASDGQVYDENGELIS